MAKSEVPAPMEALLAAELPDGSGWQFEPKWDGFRCLAKREDDEVTLTSKSGKPLARYFPEVADDAARPETEALPSRRRTDHPVGDALSFDALQLRLHPAESRVRKLAKETPAQLMAFDLLELDGNHLPTCRCRSGASRWSNSSAENAADALQLSPDDLRPQGSAWLAAAQRRRARRRHRQARRP